MRHGWIRHFVKDFEENPRFQFKFHLAMMVFWIINFVAGTLIFAFADHFWLSIGVYYVFAISIYANWDTDYDAVSASLAARHSQELLERAMEKGYPQ